MHVSEMVELSGLTAVHGSAFIRQHGAIPEESVREYWSSSKCRLDRWARALRSYCDGVDGADDNARPQLWREVRPVLEEILASEILTRVWTAAACGYDRARGGSDIEPVVWSVYLGHLEARNRALNLIVYGRGFSLNEAVALNRLRRRSERWTDLLLGHLQGECKVGELAFDAERVVEFADDLQHDRAVLQYDQCARLTVASLRSAFARQLHSSSPSADLNRQIASSVLACFHAELFDATGLFRSLWLARLQATASDTQGMIDELFALEEGTAADSTRRSAPGSDSHSSRF